MLKSSRDGRLELRKKKIGKKTLKYLWRNTKFRNVYVINTTEDKIPKISTNIK